MPVVLVVTLGLGFQGCSPKPASKPVTPAGEDARQPVDDDPGEAGPTARWWQDESIMSQLQVTQEQADAIDGLMTVHAGDVRSHRRQERQLSLRYLRVLAQDPYDAALAGRLSERLVEVRTSEHRGRIEMVRELRDILTGEQWTKLWELAPQALQLGRFRIVRGPVVSVSQDHDPSPTPTP